MEVSQELVSGQESQSGRVCTRSLDIVLSSTLGLRRVDQQQSGQRAGPRVICTTDLLAKMDPEIYLQ